MSLSSSTTMLATANKITRKQHSFTLLILFHFHISNLSETNVVAFMAIKSLYLPLFISRACSPFVFMGKNILCMCVCICHIFSHLKRGISSSNNKANKQHLQCLLYLQWQHQNCKRKSEPGEEHKQLEIWWDKRESVWERERERSHLLIFYWVSASSPHFEWLR